MKVPALYEMEPIGKDSTLEANGRVYFFCPAKDCRDVFAQSFDEAGGITLGFGWDDDHIQGTVCDHCGEVLEPDTATAI